MEYGKASNRLTGQICFYSLIVLTAFLLTQLSGCYYIPYKTKLFLDDYNKRHPPGPSPETIDESLDDFKTYQAQSLTIEDWLASEHYADIKNAGGDKWKNINFILENMPQDRVLLDSDNKEVLTFTGHVDIDSIGSVNFPVIYPGIKYQNTLSILETVTTLQGNIANKKLGI